MLIEFSTDADALRRNAWMTLRAVVIVFWCSLLLCQTGCSTIGKRKSQGNAIAAREMTRLGQEAMFENRWGEAKTRLAHAVELCPEDVTARRHFAHSLWQLGEKPEAIEHLREAILLSGGDPYWTVELGNMLLSENNLEAAMAAADQALRVDDRLCGAWVLRGKVLLQQGNGDDALNAFHRARSLGQVGPEVLTSMSTIYEQMQRPHRVLATLQRLQEQVGMTQLDAKTLQRKGTALRHVGRLDEAVETLANAHQRSPGNQAIIVQLAECQFASGSVAEARSTIDLAKSMGPLNPTALELVAKLDPMHHGIDTILR